ncbi:MAG: hypothetical protein ACLFQ6_09275 [Candidatus Sumerlaeia bacterium]
MTSAISQLVLSGRLFTGRSASTREARMDDLARYSDPENLCNALMQARGKGINAVFSLAEENLIKALKLMRKKLGPAGEFQPFNFLPVIPNVLGYVREATEYGLAGAGMRRLLRVGPMGFMRASTRGALNAPKVMHKDFPTLLSILYELEMGELHAFKPPVVFLHHQMTDIALSLGNARILREYAGIMRKRFKVEPGLCTTNFVRLADYLVEWDIPIQVIAAPCNEKAYLMPGGVDAYRKRLESGRFTLVADRPSSESPTPSDAIDWCLDQPNVGAVIVDAEIQRIPAARTA